MENPTYTVGRYLLDRLAELGIDHLFGVPGDYNLNFLSQVMTHETMTWVGNRNELNAAYAADGYARLKGIGALVTTYGVGELSAINGVAGSFAERVPVVAITGTPATSVMAQGLLVHHSLADGQFGHFQAAYREVTAAQTILQADTAPLEIDRVLRTCWTSKRPVYIALPSDVSGQPAAPPAGPLLGFMDLPASDPENLEEVRAQIARRARSARKPVILADFEVNRYHAEASLLHLVERSGFPVATLSMGKGVIAENHPQFIGVYNGGLSAEYLKERIAQSDCLILVGVQLIDTLTGSFTDGIDLDAAIAVHPHHTNIGAVRYDRVNMEELLTALSGDFEPRDPSPLDSLPALAAPRQAEPGKDRTAALTQEHFWSRFGQFLTPGDVLIADQGTAYFGAASISIPEHTAFVGQPLWGSIGYTLPALLGTQLAFPERRNILVIGDGSFQLTVQELSTMIKWRLHPIVMLLNNDGYTVERAIHGPDEPYNDIPMWSYHQIPQVFGDSTCLSLQVSTVQQLDDALAAAEIAKDRMVFVEVLMGRLDAPDILNRLGRAMAAQNHY